MGPKIKPKMCKDTDYWTDPELKFALLSNCKTIKIQPIMKAKQ